MHTEESTEDLIESRTEQTVVFRLVNESYGIDISRVNEIILSREITPVPRTAAHIRGLVNLRGKTIPVVDLKSRLAMDASEETDSTRIIVVDTSEGLVGVIVDGVSEVTTLERSEIEKPPDSILDLDTDFVRGIAKHKNKLVTLLDLDKALSG